MRQEYLDSFRLSNGFEFCGANYFEANSTYFLISPTTGTTILLNSELFEELVRKEPSEDLQFKLVQRALASFPGSRPTAWSSEEISPSFFMIDMTKSCALRCLYCFRCLSDDGILISGKVVDDICDYLIDYCKKHHKNRIEIQPWGGEPLLAFDKIKRIDDRMKAAGVDARISIETSGVLITEDVARECYERNFKVGISIDGPKDLHNRQRLLANGAGSFDKTLAGFKTLRSAGYGTNHASITTVTSDSVKRAKEIVDFFTEEIELRQFKFNLTKQNPQMRRAGLELSVEEAKEFAGAMFDALVEACKRGRYVSEGNVQVKIMNLLERRRSSICLSRGCMGARRLIGFDREGRIFSCDMTESNEWAFGTIYDGRDLVDMIREASKTHPFFQKKTAEKCEKCAWRFFCRGGCTSASFYRRGKFTGEIDEMECAYNETLYPKIVELILTDPETVRKLTPDEQKNSRFGGCVKCDASKERRSQECKRRRRSGYIALTEACSRRCLACPCNKPNDADDMKRLSLRDVERTVELALERGGLDVLTLSGGEPTTHPEIMEILQYLAQKPIATIGFLTTGERFRKREFLDRVLEILPPKRLRATIALHSFNAEKHDAFVNRKGSFYESLDGLNALIEAGVPCSLKYIVSQLTYRDFVEYVREYYSRFPSSTDLVVCNLDFCGVADTLKDRLKASFEEVRPYLEKGLDLVEEREKNGDKRFVGIFDTPLCAISPRYWKYLPKITDENLAIFNGPRVPNFEPREDVPNDSGPFFQSCKRCKVASICPGTWRTALNVWGEDVFKPFE